MSVRVLFMVGALLVPGIASGAGDDYVNPALCAGCHAGIADAYKKSGMGRSFSRAAPQNGDTFYHVVDDTYYEMAQRDGEPIQRRFQIGYRKQKTNLDEETADYAIGSGIHARAWLHRAPDGELFELPLAWYSEKGGYFAMAPGYDSSDHPYARRPLGYDCMFCHNAYPKIPPGGDVTGTRAIFEGQLPEGIDCQRCHGPGARHVQAASVPHGKPADIRAAIFNPAHAAGERQDEVCMQCHLQTTPFRLPHAVQRYERGAFSYRPGEPLESFVLAFAKAPEAAGADRYENVSTAFRLRQSQCFIKSAGALKCTTCHDPHGLLEIDSNAVCRQCHGAPFTRLVAAGKHTAQAECVTCHMPQRRPDDVVHIVKTDHWIQRRKPVGDLLMDIQERHDGSAGAVYKGEVVPFYPAAPAKTAANELYLAVAQVRDGSNLAAGIPRLERAIAALHPQRPEPYLDLAEALRGSGQFDKAAAAYKESLLRDPKFAAALRGLGFALKQSGKPTEAADAFRRAEAWDQLGQVSLDLGRNDEARAAFEKALAVDAEQPESHNGLGIVRAQSGDLAGAEAEFREAIRILPNYGEAHGNLANLLDIRQDREQAIYEYQRAVDLKPDDAVTRFNFGAMLAGLARFDEAREQMTAAVRANPNIAEAHEMLGRLEERRNDFDAALKEYRDAVRIRPDLAQAQLDLGAMLAKKGDVAGATEHLRIAAGSSDATLRGIARQMLEGLGAKP